MKADAARASTRCFSTSCTSRTRISCLGRPSASLHRSFFATTTHVTHGKRTLSVTSPPPIIREPASRAATAMTGFVAEDDSNTCITKNRSRGEEIIMQSVVPPPSAADILEKLQSGITNPEIVRNDVAVERVLEEAWDFFQQQQQPFQRAAATSTTIHGADSYSQTTTSTTALLLLQRMQGFLDAWISMHVRSVTRPQTSRPFQILLEAWSSTASQNNVLIPVDSFYDSRRSSPSPGTEACQVLQRWYELLGGSIDMTPGMEHYHQVLATYANDSTNLLYVLHSQQPQQQQQQQSVTSEDQLLLQLNSLAMEAWDVVDQLKSWGYTYAPTNETNAHLIRCLSRVVIASCQNSISNSDELLFTHSSDDQDDASTFDHNALTCWNRILRTMEDINVRMESKNPKSLDEECHKESFHQLQALCDALLAAKMVALKHDTNNSHEKRFPSAGVGALENSPLLSWQSWGTTLVGSFLQQAGHLSSALEFGESNLLPYDPNHPRRQYQSASVNSQPISSAYQLLTTGCEAWQFLLCHCAPRSSLEYYHQNQQRQQPQQNHFLVASEIHDVLDRLEDIGRQRHTISGDLENSILVYFALLRHYLLTIKAWESKIPYLECRDKEKAVQRRDEVLQRWEDHHKNLLSARAATANPTIGEKNFRKNLQVQSFNSLMMAKFHIGQVNEVVVLFQKMKDFRLQVDATSYSAVLKSLADSTRDGAAEDAYKIWQKLTSSWRENPALEATVKPKSQHYTSVLVGWSRSRQSQGIAVKRVLDVFYKLQRDCEFDFQSSNGKPTLKISPIHYAMVLTTLARSRQRSQEVDAVTMELVKKVTSQGPLDARIYNAIMNALSRVGTLEAATMANNLLDEMEYHHRQTGDPFVKPTAKNYGYCMNAWSRSAVKEGPVNAHRNIEVLLLRLESEFLASGNDPSLLPGSACYYMLLTSLINTGVSDMGDKADAILRQVVHKAAMGQAEYPSEFVYNKVIEAHRKGNAQDCAEKAEAVLHMMLAAYSHELEKPSGAKPTAFSYNGVIHAWSRSSAPNKAVRAESLFQELEQLFQLEGDAKLMPDEFTFTAVLNTCAHLPGKSDPHFRMDALRIALETIQKVEAHHGVATSDMFYLALKTCYDNSQGMRQKTECASVLFKNCCRQGLVNNSVLDILRLCAPLFYQKLPSSLPTGWTVNARGWGGGHSSTSNIEGVLRLQSTAVPFLTGPKFACISRLSF